MNPLPQNTDDRKDPVSDGVQASSPPGLDGKQASSPLGHDGNRISHRPTVDSADAALYAEAKERLGHLLLPECAMRLRVGRTVHGIDVYDPLRQRWVALTPEEWVRQHFVAYMVEALGYSPHRMANEVTLTFNGMSRRADTVVYDKSLRPLVVVEYKAADVALDTAVLEQALRYNMVFGAPTVMITNGMDVYSANCRGGNARRIVRGVIPAAIAEASAGL